jgi:hypothetical protein
VFRLHAGLLPSYAGEEANDERKYSCASHERQLDAAEFLHYEILVLGAVGDVD